MGAKYILAAFALIFLIAAARRSVRSPGRLPPQARTWLVVAAIFAAVSTWLFLKGS